MKKIDRLVLSMLVFSLFSSSYCLAESNDWEKAKSENTIAAYEEFIQKHPNEETIQEANKILEELYLQSIKQTEIYNKWVEEYQQQNPSSDLTDSSLIQALSRSTEELATRLMDKALSVGCDGYHSDYAAVLGISESHNAMLLSPEINISLPDDLKATTPGDFYYAICITRKVENRDKCEYQDPSGISIGYLITARWLWKIEMRESRTGKLIKLTDLYGDTPSCPSTSSFPDKGDTQVIFGTEPSVSDAIDWIKNTIEKVREPVLTVIVKGRYGLFLHPDDPYASTTINEGSKLTVLFEEGEWYKVETEDHTVGYIRKSQVSW